MEISIILLFNLILGAAAFATALTGFGFALMATPFLILFFPPYVAVPVVVLCWMFMAALLVWECRREMSLGRIGWLLAGAAAGIPLGVWGLACLEDHTMRSLIGAISLGAVAAFWLKPSHPFRRERLAMLVAGVLSGVMGGASGISGPPLVLLGLNQNWEHRGFRADMIGFFAASFGMMLLVLGNFGVMDRSTLAMSAWALPGMLLGYAGGIWLKQYVSQQRFRTLALSVVGAGSLLALALR